MGNAQDVYTELRTRYKTGWSPPPTEYPNESFDNVQNNIWARFTIVDEDNKQLDIGDPVKTFRASGDLIIQLFAPPNSGTIEILKKADVLADVFRNWYGNKVACRPTISGRSVSVNKIGSQPDGWYQVNVVIPFKSDFVA